MPLIRGAFLRLEGGALRSAPNAIVFQFNPETITRSPTLVNPPVQSDGSGPKGSAQQPAEPGETIGFSLRLDATESLARGDPVSRERGVLPEISALELLLYSTESLPSRLFAGGKKPHKNPPTEPPVVLFFWGLYRVLPVVITSLSITETVHDQLLNPVRAEVSVNLTVLTPGQLTKGAVFPRDAYLYSFRKKEEMAALRVTPTPDAVSKAIQSVQKDVAGSK